MSGTPSAVAMTAIRSAIIVACASLSITQGPAIRKKADVPPTRKLPIGKLRDRFMTCLEQNRFELTGTSAYAASSEFSTWKSILAVSNRSPRTGPCLGRSKKLMLPNDSDWRAIRMATS